MSHLFPFSFFGPFFSNFALSPPSLFSFPSSLLLPASLPLFFLFPRPSSFPRPSLSSFPYLVTRKSTKA